MPNKPKYPMKGISIPPALHQEAKEVGKMQNKNFNQVVIEALELWLNAQ